VYYKNGEYLSDVFPFIGIKITKNLKINAFYGMNLLYNNITDYTNGNLYGYGISYELDNKYEIGINYKEIENETNNNSITIFFNFKIK
jgi:hypothetical protein